MGFSKVKDSIELYRKKYNMTERFPYKKYFLDVNKLLLEAQEYKPWYGTEKMRKEAIQELDLDKYKEGHTLIFTNFRNEPEFNFLTDYYTEECRLNCRLESRELSPHDDFLKNKKDYIELVKKKFGKASYQNLNKFINSKLKPCTNYKLSYLFGVLDIFKPKKWLDTSAGWGDRLLSALLGGVEQYYGIDPNPCMQPFYKDMVKDLVSKREEKDFTVVEGKAEDKSIYPKEKFDFIFTSPPFFTFELYNEVGDKKENQSTFNFKSVNEWLHKFLFKMMDNAWPLLEKGGNFVLYIEDKPEYRFISEMLKYMEKKKGSKYNGIIYQVAFDDKWKDNPYIAHTLYCWEKI
jgi:16S rRNA G966 N2-methylase RsmD